MKKVYIVDDDRNIVESLTIVLKKEGFEVKAQYDEKNVVQNIKSFKPDCVILDVMFPENDGAGIEMSRLIRADAELKGLPVLMLSAVNEKGSYAGTFSNKDLDDAWLPVSAFIEKPINPKDLVVKVKNLIANSKA